jgi:site-specific DNA recombinase
MVVAPKIIRCAVYTRKSTEHNLDLEFNSLDAQRESCEAYIKSQMHEGWQLLPDRYDDGGISGGSLERPDLQRLLADIRARRIDNVVVYKVDRLTRSLTDFAKLVELFDAHGVSFVSVTQAFNTTNSMGRLTLNVLLSFAQFEREVIAERVRDKVAASKRKGLWMGGSVPLGFINQDKKLVIVPKEAETVRWIFQKYLELGAIGPLLQELDRVGLKTKPRCLASGRVVGGKRFGKGVLNHLLKNRSYIGELTHRGEIHAADHEPILNRSLFEAVQAKMAANNIEKKRRVGSSPYLLTGLIFDSAGNRMSPTHTLKKGVRYRYYVSQAVAQCRKEEAGAIARVPATDVEAVVSGLITTRFGVPGVVPCREVLEAHIYKVTVQAEALEIALLPVQRPGNRTSGPFRPPETVSLPWARKPFAATKAWPMPRLTGRLLTPRRGTPPSWPSAKPGSGSTKSWPAAPSQKSPSGKAGVSVRSGCCCRWRLCRPQR